MQVNLVESHLQSIALNNSSQFGCPVFPPRFSQKVYFRALDVRDLRQLDNNF